MIGKEEKWLHWHQLAAFSLSPVSRLKKFIDLSIE
jgi:hypothetical protein